MAEQNISPRDFFATESAIADLGLIACPGAEELCKLVDGHLVRWAREVGMDVDTFIIPSDCPRFQSGDAKGLVKASTRGDDLYIFVWTALLRCSSCAMSALRTSSPLMPMTPAS